MGETTYRFATGLRKYFDFFQVKSIICYEYSCIEYRFFGLKVFVEDQRGYDVLSICQTRTPLLETENVLVAKVVLNELNENEAKRIFSMGIFLSDLATRCSTENGIKSPISSQNSVKNEKFSFQIKTRRRKFFWSLFVFLLWQWMTRFLLLFSWFFV